MEIPQLAPASEYGYPTSMPLMERFPLATSVGVRTAEFPATNSPLAPLAGGGTKLAASQGVYECHDDDGGVYRMVGVRREKHRRFLEFLFLYSEPLPIGEDGACGFMFKRKAAAKAITGDADKYLRIDELVEELSAIKLYYTAPGHVAKDGIGEFQYLGAGYRAKYAHGEKTYIHIDDALRDAGFDPQTFNGYSFIKISAMFMGRFLKGWTMRYHQALPTIFKMSPEAAGLARYALSWKFLNWVSLNDILDKIGVAASGGARDDVVRDIKSPVQRDLLLSVGIRVHRIGKTNKVYYKKEVDKEDENMTAVPRVKKKPKSFNALGIDWDKAEAVKAGRWKDVDLHP